ncbi:rRNA 2'-O-methyltransferase fibrillarin-like [Miscanthus floridulus]|uniref:rRNA 2'-O-methyltransferase fibrillarin-like n=1 Tax=Miscanthus floridulus TaxID=154761 RepID=UPI00345927BF
MDDVHWHAGAGRRGAQAGCARVGVRGRASGPGVGTLGVGARGEGGDAGGMRGRVLGARRGTPGGRHTGVGARGVRGWDAGGQRVGAGAEGRVWDAGGRRVGAGARGRVRDTEHRGLVWEVARPAAKTLGTGSLSASEEEDSAQTMTPVHFLLFILGTICRGGS